MLAYLDQYLYVNDEEDFYVPWSNPSEIDIEDLLYKYHRLFNGSYDVFVYPFSKTLDGLVRR